VRRLRQDYEERKGPPSGGTPPHALREKKALTRPVRAIERTFLALGSVLAVVGRAFLVVGRIVGYALLIVAALAVSVALGACIAVALEYLVGWPDTWWL
jgi:hypothetical protein